MQSHVRKFTSFVSKNEDAPYKVKKVVWESALKGALYVKVGCVKTLNLPLSHPYLTIQTLLVGVHKSNMY